MGTGYYRQLWNAPSYGESINRVIVRPLKCSESSSGTDPMRTMPVTKCTASLLCLTCYRLNLLQDDEGDV